jgi:hypothetical protein
VAGFAVVALVARSVANSWDQVRAMELNWEWSVGPLAAGVLVVWLVFLVLSEAWRRMVVSWGFPLPWWPAARIWLLSSMAKYVPGKVWAVAGMAVMAQQRGVPVWAATGSAILLQAISLGTGVLVIALAGVTVLDAAGIGRATLGAAAAASVAVTALLAWPPFTARLVGRFTSDEHAPQTLPVGSLALGTAANLGAWLGYGVALWLFAAGTLPEAGLTLPEAIGVNTAAYLGGVLAPFAPGGLGVREGILVVALRDRTGLAHALAIAAVARLGVTLAEIGASIPFALRGGTRPS